MDLIVKALGGLLIVGGVWFMFVSQDIRRYQQEYHSNLSIYIGLGMIIAGILMVAYG
jgi:uncharacterized membrane protein YidH (DUF202 family)